MNTSLGTDNRNQIPNPTGDDLDWKTVAVKLMNKTGEHSQKRDKELRIREFKLTDSATSWIEDFERKAEYSDIPTKDWKRYVGKNIGQAHSTAYKELYDNLKDKDWVEFRKEFIKNFEVGHRSATARQELKMLKPSNFLSNDLFFEKCYQLIGNIGDTDGSAVGFKILGKFPVDVQRAVNIKGLDGTPHQVINKIRDTVRLEEGIKANESQSQTEDRPQVSYKVNNKRGFSGYRGLPYNKNSRPDSRNTTSNEDKTEEQNKDNDNPKKWDKKDITCYGCQQTGHYKRECPKRGQNNWCVNIVTFTVVFEISQTIKIDIF